MRIYTRIIIDMNSGEIIRREGYEYSGPIASCDRSLMNQENQAQKNAVQTAGNYGSSAGRTGGFLSSQLERFAANPPGYSAADESGMESRALLGGAAQGAATNERAKLRTMRSGNVAGLGAQEAANTEAAARGTGGMLQTILANNAALKQRQQQSALGELGGMYGTDVRGQLAAEGLEPEDINAGTRANQTGWLQNTLATLDTLAKMGSK